MEQKLPTTKGLQIIVVYVVMAVISTITFALRVYVRSSMVKRSWEDWAAGFGWFVYILFCCVTIVGPFYGTGQHADLVTPENLSIALRVSAPINILAPWLNFTSNGILANSPMSLRTWPSS